jgi:uncharacterized sulfatase
MRSHLLLILAVVIYGPAAVEPALAGPPPSRRPNIVLIVGDDHGWPYAGFMGDEVVSTPNLDRLADSGMTFTHAFSSASVCGPALQTLLSGLHGRSWTAQRSRLEVELGQPIPMRSGVEHYVTLPRQLARQGYRSFQGGKHWEGSFRMAGFDEGTAVTLHSNPLRAVGDDVFGRVNLEPLPGFLDEVGEQPFFLWVAPKLPHTPHDASAGFRAEYEELGLVEGAVLYYANITRLDHVIGEVIQELESRSLLDDSLIIYVSDNGWEQSRDREHFLGRGLGGEKGKLSIHELGFRTPLIVNWPGFVPEGRVEDLVTFEDLVATILEYAGAPLPPDHGGRGLRGRIEGRDGPARDRVIGVQDVLRVRESEYVPIFGIGAVLRLETAAFLRTARWRYIEYLDRGERLLYRIDQDPFEEEDVAEAHPELLTRFAAETAAWRDALAAPAAWMDLLGQLKLEEGVPDPGLRIWLDGHAESSRGIHMQVFSDARGFFRLPNVPAGEYTLRWETQILAAASGAAGGRSRVRETGSRELDLTGYQTSPFIAIPIPGTASSRDPIPHAPGTLAIDLVDRDDEPVAGVPLRILGWTVQGIVELQVLSGPDGFAALDQLPMGFYRVSASPERDQHPTSRWIFLEPGTSQDVELVLRGRGRG